MSGLFYLLLVYYSLRHSRESGNQEVLSVANLKAIFSFNSITISNQVGYDEKN